MKPTLKQLGWKEASPVVLGLPEPFDTWADMTTLLDNGLRMAREGLTSLDEVLRILPVEQRSA